MIDNICVPSLHLTFAALFVTLVSFSSVLRSQFKHRCSADKKRVKKLGMRAPSLSAENPLERSSIPAQKLRVKCNHTHSLNEMKALLILKILCVSKNPRFVL